MSLKAKIEAVLYASEEPVTLAQLVGLLGEEAQAELDRADSAQGSLSLNETEAEFEAADFARDPAGQDTAVRDTADREPSPATEHDHSPAAQGEVAAAADRTASPDDSAPAPAPPAARDGYEAAGEPAGLAHGSSADDAPDPSGTAENNLESDVSSPEASAAASADVNGAAAARAERARLARLRGHFRSVLDGLIAEYTNGDRGLEIREIAGGFRFATKPEYHDAVRGFVRSLKPPLKLTLQALETLAVVAYKQPVTSPEISEIRGVDSGGVLGSLIARKLITTAGRKQVIGRPILYKTTREFLLKFGLKDVNELPSIEEFERMAGQMAEQEEIAMPDAADPRPDVDSNLEQTADKLEPERDTHAAQADGEVAPADNLGEAAADKASVDGRLTSLPPDYAAADAADDPSAQEAEIQQREES